MCVDVNGGTRILGSYTERFCGGASCVRHSPFTIDPAMGWQMVAVTGSQSGSYSCVGTSKFYVALPVRPRRT